MPRKSGAVASATYSTPEDRELFQDEVDAFSRTLFSQLNIADLLNKSRGDIAYTIIDLDDDISEATLDSIRKIEGVLALRYLPCKG